MEDFGRTPNELFSTFSEHPVAAASLAQVNHCRILFLLTRSQMQTKIIPVLKFYRVP